MVDFNTWTDEQLIELIKLRLINESFPGTIKNIKIVKRIKGKYLGVRYIIKSNVWHDEEYGILLNKFYLNEISLIQSMS